MRTIRILSAFLFFSALFASCGKSAGDRLPTVEVNGAEIDDLDPDLLTPVDVKLSQIADNIDVIILETDSICVLSESVDFQVGNKYIIARDVNGTYQFSLDGSFVRKLVTRGRGPGETPTSPQFLLLEEEDVLITVDPDNINTYDLSTGLFLGTRGKPNLEAGQTLKKGTYIGDSRILITYTRGIQDPDMNGAGVIIQDFDGRLLWQKEFDFRSWTVFYTDDRQTLTGSEIFILSTDNPDEYILQPHNQDTVYILNTNTLSLSPDFLKRTEKEKIDGYPVAQTVVNCSIEDEEFARVNGYQLMNMRKVTDMGDQGPTGGYRSYVLYDSNTNMAYRIGALENDYLGFFHKTEGDMERLHNFPVLVNPYGKLVEKYDAFTFIQLAEEALANPGLNTSVKERLLGLREEITETSNPVLVIGDMKRNIGM